MLNLGKGSYFGIHFSIHACAKKISQKALLQKFDEFRQTKISRKIVDASRAFCQVYGQV